MRFLLLILIPFFAFGQTIDERVESEYAKVTRTSIDSVIINQYFESVRIETNQTFEKWSNLDDYPISDATPLPNFGRVQKDIVYSYNDTLYLCRQPHTRTIYHPKDTPALFSYVRDNATDTLQWAAGEEVETGWVRTYETVNYECIQPHMTQAGYEPPNTPALWSEIQEGNCPEWVQPEGSHDAYDTGDCVTFEGKCYESTIDANVWSPSAYPAGWNEVECY